MNAKSNLLYHPDLSLDWKVQFVTLELFGFHSKQAVMVACNRLHWKGIEIIKIRPVDCIRSRGLVRADPDLKYLKRLQVWNISQATHRHYHVFRRNPSDIIFRVNTWYFKILLGRCAVYHILIWGGIVKPLQTKVRFN